ncbi:MAG: bifunctional 2-polyprenyl-6-hydroxyphenol methylase/3-demethylubiquinol 3-O-methyltransferase UbiG [Pseudomonadota bacterium]
MVKTIENDAKPPLRPSIDADEVAKFAAMADEWWDPKGKFRPLHKFNPTRLGFIRDRAEDHFGLERASRKPLSGLRLVDIGCGGGLVAEPMARLGASVTGIDASEENIKTALTHAKSAGLDIDYRAGTVEGLVEAGEAPFDIVLSLEVVEHVANPPDFLKTCASLVAPGGLMILATINRTAKSFAFAIIGAEYVLRWLPRGTHDWNKFLTPEELAAPARAAGLHTEPPVGVAFNPVTDAWNLSKDPSVNYMLVATRPAG